MPDCCTVARQEALKAAGDKWAERTARAERENVRLRGIIVRLMSGDERALRMANREAREIVELYIR
jgi:hypothetical protein